MNENAVCFVRGAGDRFRLRGFSKKMVLHSYCFGHTQDVRVGRLAHELEVEVPARLDVSSESQYKAEFREMCTQVKDGVVEKDTVKDRSHLVHKVQFGVEDEVASSARQLLEYHCIRWIQITLWVVCNRYDRN